MKKIIVIISLILVSYNASAQFAFGLAGNYTTSLGFDQNWNFDSERLKFKNETAHGFSAGIFLRGGKRFFVQPELMYNFMLSTVTIEQNNSGEVQKKKIYLNTINLPILLGGKIISTSFFNLRIMLGPRFRFDVGSKNEGANNIETTPRKWQLGLETGVGFDLGRVTIDGRYNLMQDVFSYKFSSNELNFSPINSFSIGIGVKLIDVKSRK